MGLGGCAAPPPASGPLPSARKPTAVIPSTSTARPTALRPVKTTATPTPSPSPTPLVALPPNALPEYTLDIALNYADRRMRVHQQVVARNPGPDHWDEVVFAVPPAHYPDVFTLSSVEALTTWTRRPATFTLEHTMLHVGLPAPLLPGEVVGINLSFVIAIPPVTLNDWLPRGNLGAGDRLIQAGDWHPTLAPYRPGVGWHTWDYYLVGDPNVYGAANYDVTFRTDAATVVAAPGSASQIGTTRRYQLTGARCFAFLASPEYRFAVGKVGQIPLRVYYLPGYDEAAQVALDTSIQAIALYETLYGPYPTTGLVIAQNAYVGAMEYSGLISLSHRAFETSHEQSNSSLVNLTVHEIAHQWWYGAVGNDQVYEPWLDEAFAKYSEVLFYERYHPELVDWWWERHIYANNPSGPVDRSIYDFATTSEYISQVYAQGACFLGDLRVLLGDAAFFAFARDYRAMGEGRLMTRADFFAAVRAHTDADLSELIAQYFEE
ncbi:MAG TPA: M1 family metallopeptidase [Anaerolineae bacterium]|nr:M1 family metallopeptidase [Anaerolineae bacterium]